MARKPDLAKREEIAQAAFGVMRERGVFGTSMSDLAKALDMKRSTLYWYFQDMNAIFEVVLAQILGDVEQHIQTRLESYSHPIDMVYQVGVAIHEYFDDREDTIVLLFQLWATGGGQDHNRVFAIAREYNKPRREMMAALLQQGIEDGLVAPCDPMVLVQTLASFADGLLVNRVAGLVSVPPLLSFLWEHLLLPLKREPA